MQNYNLNTPINQWADDDRPREKLILKGKRALSDAELLAILIGSGTREESAVDLCKRILASCSNSLNQLGRLEVMDLVKFKGIGEAKAISIIAALEIGRRRRELEPEKRPIINSSAQLFNILYPLMADLNVEEFWMVHLNKANKVMFTERVSSGGVSGTLVDPKRIFSSALNRLSAGIIVAHNHPSGALKPSQQDIRLTKTLYNAGNLLDIKLLDHIIIAGNSYFSFADQHLL